MSVPPLSLPPPPVPLTGRRTFPVENSPHIGKEVAFEDLVPGKSYFRKFSYWPNNTDGDYDEFKLIYKTKELSDQDQDQFVDTYAYTIPRPVRYMIDPRGDPLPPEYIPQAPSVIDQYGMIQSQIYDPRYYRFYEVDPVKRGKHLIGPQIKEKVKKDIKRKHLNLILDKLGFSTDLGTGPSDIIRKMVALQPPKGTAKVPSAISRRHGGKRRKTRKSPK